MTDALPETAHFGLTRVGDGEALSKNGWSSLDLDRIKLDELLYAALTHKHDDVPALGDPTDPPGLAVVSTGGTLPAATTYYYRVSFVDQWGLETAASPEASITTPDPIAPPTAPGATTDTVSGNLAPGVYGYLITFLDAFGGESTPSPMNTVRVLTGTTNRVLLDLPTLPTGATAVNIYRSRPGQSAFYLLSSNVTASSFYDTGQTEDQTIQAPTGNTTNASNLIQVTIPLAFIPLGCVSWKIYRATASGAYLGDCLVHNVIEGNTDTSPTPRTMWQDIGDALLQGFPQNSSSTVPASPLLTLNDLAGALPVAAIPRGVQCLSVYGAGVLTDSRILSVTESPFGLSPARLTAFFQTPPSGGLATPAAPTATGSTTGGTLAAGSYTYRLTATDANGESLPSPESTTVTTTGTTSSVSLSWTAVTNATGYKLYGRTAGGELLIGSTSSTSFTDTGSVTPSGALPTTDTSSPAVRVRITDNAATPNFVELSCSTSSHQSGDPTGYFHAEFPLVASGEMDAKAGTHSSNAIVVTDDASTIGEAVYLASSGDSVTMDFGSLDSGSYQVFVDTRPGQDTAVTGDLQVQVIRSDTSAVLASATYAEGTVANGYRETTALTFTAPGGVDVIVTVSKATTGAQQYYVDYARFVATVPTLQAGQLTVETFVDHGPTSAADVNVAVWF